MEKLNERRLKDSVNELSSFCLECYQNGRGSHLSFEDSLRIIELFRDAYISSGNSSTPSAEDIQRAYFAHTRGCRFRETMHEILTGKPHPFF